MSQRSPLNKRNLPNNSEEKSQASSGMARKSAASAKPARAAAGSVRVVSVSKDKDGFTQTKGMTKEEKKALKKAERAEEDQIAHLTDLVTKNNPTYAYRRRIWWIFMGLGLGSTVITFVISYVATSMGETGYSFNTTAGIVSIITLVLAYVFIITALVWEFVKLRPIRMQTNEKITNMSAKRRAALEDECLIAEADRKEAKRFGKKSDGEKADK